MIQSAILDSVIAILSETRLFASRKKTWDTRHSAVRSGWKKLQKFYRSLDKSLPFSVRNKVFSAYTMLTLWLESDQMDKNFDRPLFNLDDADDVLCLDAEPAIYSRVIRA